MSAELAITETSDQVIAAAQELGSTLNLVEFGRAQAYAKLYARWQLEKVAAEEHRQGRHTLAQSILTRAEGLR